MGIFFPGDTVVDTIPFSAYDSVSLRLSSFVSYSSMRRHEKLRPETDLFIDI